MTTGIVLTNKGRAPLLVEIPLAIQFDMFAGPASRFASEKSPSTRIVPTIDVRFGHAFF